MKEYYYYHVISLPNHNKIYIYSWSQYNFLSFIWNSGINRIKRDVFIKVYEGGGVKMVDWNRIFVLSKQLG